MSDLSVTEIGSNLDQSFANGSVHNSDIYRNIFSLKLVTTLALLSNVYNRDLLFDIADLTVCCLTHLGDRLLVKVLRQRSGNNNNNNNNNNKMFDRGLCMDLLTVFGLFDFFDIQLLLRSDFPKAAKFRQILGRLKTFNENFYDDLRLSKDENDDKNLVDLIQYNFSLFNLDIQLNRSIDDLFRQFRSVESLAKHFSYLNGVKKKNNFLFFILRLIFF